MSHSQILKGLSDRREIGNIFLWDTFRIVGRSYTEVISAPIYAGCFFRANQTDNGTVRLQMSLHSILCCCQWLSLISQPCQGQEGKPSPQPLPGRSCTSTSLPPGCEVLVSLSLTPRGWDSVPLGDPAVAAHGRQGEQESARQTQTRKLMWRRAPRKSPERPTG